MVKLTKIMLVPLLIVALIMGCSQDEEQLNAPIGPSAMLAASLSDLTASSIQSATLILRVSMASGNEVSVHAVTAPWDEMIVTYNSFGGAFDGAVVGSYTAAAIGMQHIDVTSLVTSWLDGSVANNGVLLKHADLTYPISAILSREFNPNYVLQPRLEVCYQTGAGIECSTLVATADTYLHELKPDNNFGFVDELYAGYYLDTELEKHILIRFYIPTNPDPASIGDYVWLDANENGIQDDGDAGISDIEVQLYDCLGSMIATTMTDATGYYLFDNLIPGDYNVMFVSPVGYVFSPQDMGADDAMDSDADPSTGATVCTSLESGENDLTWDAGIYMPVIECDECDGKITSLTMEYQGAAEALVEVFAKGHHGDQGQVLFSGQVLPGADFLINGYDRHGTVGTEIYLYVGGVFNTQIHTSCSQPIYIGMVSGDFEILDGYSRHGGRLCPGDGGGSNGGGDECSDCEGKVTELTLTYNGAADATVEVYAKGKHGQQGALLFSGPFVAGGSFNFVGQDRKGTMGVEISIFVDGSLNTKIHTSCSQPIYIGMVSGDFEVLDGYSKKGGQICPAL